MERSPRCLRLHILAALATLFLAPASLRALEQPELHFDERAWKEGYRGQQGDQYLVEFILEGQTAQTWTELVTVQVFPGAQARTSAKRMIEMMHQVMARTTSRLSWRELAAGERDGLYEWWGAGDPRVPDQHELVRILVGREGIHVVHYAIKSGQLAPAKRQQWLRLLKSVRLVNR